MHSHGLNEMLTSMCSFVGHFILTNGLLPLLKAASEDEDSDVRIVTVTGGNNIFPPDYRFEFTSPGFLNGKIPYIPWKFRYFQSLLFNIDLLHYSLSKVASLLFAQELQRRLDQQNLPIISLSLHPGGAKGVETSSALNALAWFMKPIIRKMMFSEDEGSFTSLYAATAKDVREKPELYKGKFLMPYGEIVSPHRVTENRAQIQGLWLNTTTEVNKYLVKKGYANLLDW